MRRALLALAWTALNTAGAQRPKSPRPPAPTPAPTAAVAPDTGTQDFTVGGIRVILRRNPANDVIAANLYLLGGVRQVPAEQAGLESFLLAVSEQGTKSYPKAKLREAMARLGTSIGSDADRDWTMFGIRATSATLDSTWAVFADRLMHPVLEETEIEFMRDLLINGVRQRRDDPDSYLKVLSDSITFAGHPYAIFPVGTEQSLARITRADLLKYQREQMVTSRMMLVAVGNISRAQVERLIRGSLAALPKGSYTWTLPDTLPHGAPALVVESRQLPTNYLQGTFAGPAATSPDYTALRVACAVLSGQLFSEIRGRRNLTYEVNAPFVEGAYATAGLYVSTVAPDSVLALMREELTQLMNVSLDPAGLNELINQFVTDYYMDNETNSKQADGLARAQLYRGDWRTADRFLADLRQVTPDDVQRVTRKYFSGMRLAYIGDPRRLTRSRVARF